MPQRTLAASSRADRARLAERHPMPAHRRGQPVTRTARSTGMTPRRAGTTASALSHGVALSRDARFRKLSEYRTRRLPNPAQHGQGGASGFDWVGLGAVATWIPLITPRSLGQIKPRNPAGHTTGGHKPVANPI